MQNVLTENITVHIKNMIKKTTTPHQNHRDPVRMEISNGNVINAVESLTSVKKEGQRTSVNLVKKKQVETSKFPVNSRGRCHSGSGIGWKSQR